MIGEFYGVLADIKSPIIVPNEIIENNTGDLIYNIEKSSFFIDNTQSQERVLYGMGGLRFNTTQEYSDHFKKLCLYPEQMFALFSENGEIKIVSESEKEKYESEGWFEDKVPYIMYTDDNKLHFVKEENYEEKKLRVGMIFRWLPCIRMMVEQNWLKNAI